MADVNERRTFKVKLLLIQALAQKSVQEKEFIISVKYRWTNLSLGSLFGITQLCQAMTRGTDLPSDAKQ